MSGVELGLAIAGLVGTGAMPLLSSAVSRYRRSRRSSPSSPRSHSSSYHSSPKTYAAPPSGYCIYPARGYRSKEELVFCRPEEPETRRLMLYTQSTGYCGPCCGSDCFCRYCCCWAEGCCGYGCECESYYGPCYGGRNPRMY
jgi:hypothetical protein